MAFPVSPTEGQTYTEDNTVWIYSAVTGQWNRSVVNPGNSTDYRSGKGYVGSDLTVDGDLTLDDGGTFTTTLQTITPTANRTVSLPNATGTVALVAGSSGQLVYNNAGAQAGVPGSTVGATGNVALSLNGAASVSPFAVTGSWFAGTTPQVLIQPSNVGTTGAWSASGTGIGVNAVTGFGGNLLDLQVNGSTRFSVTSGGTVNAGTLNDTGSIIGPGNAGRITLSSALATVTFGTISNTARTGYIGTAAGLVEGLSLANDLPLRWSSTSSASGAPDILLGRDAANTLYQRNGTAAQTFRVYNTYTSSTNYELGKLEWNSNVFRIGTEKGSGGGTARDLAFQTDGFERARIDSSGRLLVNTTSSTGAPSSGSVVQLSDQFSVRAVNGGGTTNRNAITASATTLSCVIDVPTGSNIFSSFIGSLYVCQQLTDSSKSFLAEYRVKLYNSGGTAVFTLVDSVDDSSPNNVALTLAYSNSNRQITVTSTWTTATSSTLVCTLIGAGASA